MLDALVKVDSMFGLEGVSVDGVSSGEFLRELNNLAANPTADNLDIARAAMLDFITTLQKQTSRMEARFMEQAMYIAEASTDFDAFLTFAKENLRDFEARELLDKIPKLENWWSKTTDALKARGIKRPKPLEQYELLELPSDIPLIRNEVECK